MKFLLSILLLMSLVACSGSKSEGDAETNEAGTELADNEEFSEDFDFEEDEEASEEGEELAEDTAEEPVDEVAQDEPVEEEQAAMDQEEEMKVSDASPVSIDTNGEEGFHTVQKNETLMIVAFKIYGDYDQWRKLAKWNADKLGSSFAIKEGMSLKYEAPAEKFVWSPDGNPYLIRVGDTLGTISKSTYETMGYWKNIWDNNKPLIKNPNKIFAGFTLYTPVIEGRDVANE